MLVWYCVVSIRNIEHKHFGRLFDVFFLAGCGYGAREAKWLETGPDSCGHIVSKVPGTPGSIVW